MTFLREASQRYEDITGKELHATIRGVVIDVTDITVMFGPDNGIGFTTSFALMPVDQPVRPFIHYYSEYRAQFNLLVTLNKQRQQLVMQR